MGATTFGDTDSHDQQRNRRGSATTARCLLAAVAPPIGVDAVPDNYFRILSIAAILCFIAVIVLIVPTLFDYWRRWRQARRMDLTTPHKKETPLSPVAARRIERLASAGSTTPQDALGWAAENDAHGPADAQGKSGIEPGAVLGREKTILIADDDPVVTHALSRRLQHMGYTVLRSPDAVHALMGAMKARPDLVILDVNMPSGNGLAVCEMMASDPQYAGIPVIIHSVIADEATKQRCRRLGAYHVEKSAKSWTQIRSLVESLLGGGQPAPPRPSTGGPLADSEAVDVRRSEKPNETPDLALPAAVAKETEPHPPASSTASPVVAVDPTSPVCGRLLVLCIESSKDGLEFVDHQLSGLGMNVIRTSDLQEGFWTCFTEKPHVVIVQAKASEKGLPKLLNNLATHPVTRDLPVLWINEDNAVADGQVLSAVNLKVLKYPVEWEELLSELEKILPTFDRHSNDSLPKTPSPASTGGVEDAQATDADEGHMVVALEHKPLSVLCIDDDPVVARSIAIRLQPYGIKVKGADNGTQGYLLATADRPDLILLDLKMPDGDGTYVLGKLKDNPRTKDIPIVMLTVEKTAGIRRQMFSLGADAFVTKPVVWHELFAEMGHCVQLPEQLLIDYDLPEQLTIKQL